MKKRPGNKKTKVSLEIGDTALTLAELTFLKRKPCLRLIKKEISSKDDEGISRELAGLFDENAVRRKGVILNLPRHSVMARFLRLPSADADEIANMARMAAMKQMPYAPEEIVVGYKITEKLEDGYSNVFLAVVQAKIASRLVNVLKAAGITAEKMALGSEALYAWFSAAGENLKEEEKAPVSVVLNAAAEYVDMVIIENGILAFARSFPYGSRPSGASVVVDEIKKSLAIYKKEKNTTGEKIFITGADEKVSELEPLLGAVRLGQAGQVDVENKDADTRKTSFAEPIGLLLKGEAAEIDLLPEKTKEENVFHAVKEGLVKSTALLAAILLASAAIAGLELFNKTRRLASLNAEIKTMEPLFEKARKVKEDADMMRGEFRERPLAVAILVEVYKVAPPSVTLYSLDYASGESAVLKGAAPLLVDVIAFIGFLEDSPYFENVKLKYTTKKTAASGKITEFEIGCALSKNT